MTEAERAARGIKWEKLGWACACSLDEQGEEVRVCEHHQEMKDEILAQSEKIDELTQQILREREERVK